MRILSSGRNGRSDSAAELSRQLLHAKGDADPETPRADAQTHALMLSVLSHSGGAAAHAI